MTAGRRSAPVPPPPPRLPRLTLRTFTPLLVPAASLLVTVLIIFVAGQQPQTHLPFESRPSSVTDIIFDAPPVVQGQTLTTATATPALAAPMGLTAMGCDGGVDLDWNDVPGATQYRIFMNDSTDSSRLQRVPHPRFLYPFATVTFGMVDLSSATVGGLGDSTTYYFVITAHNRVVGGSAPSNTVSATTVSGVACTITPTPTATGTSTNTPTVTPTPTETSTPTPTGTATNTPTVTNTPTDTSTATNTPTVTPTPTNTPTNTPTFTPTNTPTPTPLPMAECGASPLDGRTPSLTDAVVAALGGAVSSCDEVTEQLLRTEVTALRFQLSYLADNDFAQMTSLEILDITGHSLPEGDLEPDYFEGLGLMSLTALYMGNRAATSAEFQRYRAVLLNLAELRLTGDSDPIDILYIEPGIRSVSIRTGAKVRLTVDIYGGQDKQDDSLGDADNVTFEWVSDGGGSFSESAPVGRESNGEADDRKVLHTVPDVPGTYKVTASLDDAACAGDDAQCKAEFIIIVSRSAAAAVSPSPVPCALSGDVPSVLSDSGGVQYPVFTPADGGSFVSAEGDADITAGAGSVPGCEYIGVRVDMRGNAANLNRAGNRYTLAGDVYSVAAVDSSGNQISDYEFASSVQVCVPLPPDLRGSITELGMAKVNDDGSLTLLTHRIVSVQNGAIRVCGTLGSLPAEVAAGKRGEPESPTPSPDLLSPTPESPDTGGASVPYSWVLLIAVIGIGVIMLGSATLGRRSSKSSPLP